MAFVAAMRALQLSRRFSRSFNVTDRLISTFSFSYLLPPLVSHQATGNPGHRLVCSPWFADQRRGARVNAIHLRPGNVIEKTGRIYQCTVEASFNRKGQVVESEHKQRGRGGAMMQLELRDVDSGNKVSLRFGTEEPVERVFVEEKSFTCLYTESESAFLIEPETFEQLQVPLDLFGKSSAYLKEDMKVSLQLFDGRPLSGSVPKRVICTIKETQPHMKGLTAVPRYKKALLDNGLTVLVPPYLETGEEIYINTEDNSFISRANK